MLSLTLLLFFISLFLPVRIAIYNLFHSRKNIYMTQIFFISSLVIYIEFYRLYLFQVNTCICFLANNQEMFQNFSCTQYEYIQQVPCAQASCQIFVYSETNFLCCYKSFQQFVMCTYCLQTKKFSLT